MGGRSSRYGSGVYRRGDVFWLKVRTPAAIANLLSKVFWRSSLRTNLQREAHCAARSVRAALDAGFVVVEARLRLGVLSETQAEAVITALARRALAEHEALRANAGPRSETAILAAKRGHETEADAWRDVLRRNDLGVIAPFVTTAAGDAGVTQPDWALVPGLLREAARTLTVVAEENIAREDGRYAGDHARLAARLALQVGPVPAQALDGSLRMAPRMTPARDHEEARGSRTEVETSAEEAHVSRATPSLRPSLVWDATRSGQIFQPQGPVAAVVSSGRRAPDTFDGPVGARLDDKFGEVELRPGSERRAAPARPTPLAKCAASPKPADPIKAIASGVAEAPKAPPVHAAPALDAVPAQPERMPAEKPTSATARRNPYRAKRRSAPDPVVTALRSRSPAELWDMTLEDAFAFTKAKASNSGTNAKWMKGSARGFDASGRLAMAYVGSKTRLRDITSGDSHNFVDRLALIPDIWNKGAKCSLIASTAAQVSMQALIDAANDREDARLSQVEIRAEAENWTQERFLAAVAEAQVDRLAPRTQYKHQSYFSGVFKTVIEAAGIGANPMKGAIWTRKERNKRVAEGGLIRVALGPEGRAALFSRPLFLGGPAMPDDPLFWTPLTARYAGLRLEEACQLKPEDLGEEDGIAVFHIRASVDQTLKSIASTRTVPVHPELIRLGILRLAAAKRAAGAKWLFAVERHQDGSFSSRYSKIVSQLAEGGGHLRCRARILIRCARISTRISRRRASITRPAPSCWGTR